MTAPASTPPGTAENPDIGIAAENLGRITAILSQVLADQHVLYQKTRNYHWNLTGRRFLPLHELFEKQYRMLVEAIDETAERIRVLGGVAPGSMKEFLSLASLQEDDGHLIPGEEALEALAGDHTAAVRMLRKAIDETAEENDDAGTADFLTGLLRDHEKTAWMLRSHLL